MDNDLEVMNREDLIAEIKKLREGIRQHRDSTGHELCWYHPALWRLLPEKTDPLPSVPEWSRFMEGCVRYRESLDAQAPNAPRTSQSFGELQETWENRQRTHLEPLHTGVESLVARLLDAFTQHDATGCAALFTDDGSILSPYSAEARGRDAIEATHKAWFDEGETNKRLDVLESEVSGDIGYCILAYAGDYLQPDGSYTNESGKSVNVLKKHANGEWKFHISSLNSDNPPLA